MKSANAVIPSHVVQPGLEMVIEVDPAGTLDPALGVAKRMPETGRWRWQFVLRICASRAARVGRQHAADQGGTLAPAVEWLWVRPDPGYSGRKRVE